MSKRLFPSPLDRAAARDGVLASTPEGRAMRSREEAIIQSAAVYSFKQRRADAAQKLMHKMLACAVPLADVHPEGEDECSR